MQKLTIAIAPAAGAVVAGALPAAAQDGSELLESSSMTRRLLFILFAILTPSAMPALAQDGHVTDRRTGCRVWLPLVEADVSYQWTGACKNGLADGRGVLILTSPASDKDREARREGEWRDGRQTGRGLIVTTQGSRIEGTWQAGRQNGRGLVVIADGTRFDGTIVDDAWTGPGTLITADGYKYVGDFLNFKKHGKGSYTLPRGDRYEGEWQDDQPHGRGTMTLANGKRFTGEWHTGCMVGPFDREKCWPPEGNY